MKSKISETNFYSLIVIVIALMKKVGNWCGFAAFDFQSEINLITLDYVLLIFIYE